VVGFFVNNLVLRVDLAGGPTFRAALGRARRTVLDAQAHQDLPYEKLVEAVAPEELGRSRLPLIPLMIAFEDPSSEPPPALPGLALRPFAVPGGAAKLDLTLFVNPRPEGLVCSFEYDSGLFGAEAVAALAGDLRDVLAEAAERPDEPIDAFDPGAPASGFDDFSDFSDFNDDLEVAG
jgi:non-ribosomal peptide synthetase component F